MELTIYNLMIYQVVAATKKKMELTIFQFDALPNCFATPYCAKKKMELTIFFDPKLYRIVCCTKIKKIPGKPALKLWLTYLIWLLIFVMLLLQKLLLYENSALIMNFQSLIVVYCKLNYMTLVSCFKTVMSTPPHASPFPILVLPMQLTSIEIGEAHLRCHPLSLGGVSPSMMWKPICCPFPSCGGFCSAWCGFYWLLLIPWSWTRLLIYYQIQLMLHKTATINQKEYGRNCLDQEGTKNGAFNWNQD